jgi:hypothetical protein
MATSRLSHVHREQTVLTDLEASFPHFAGQAVRWTKVPDGQDPPDFVGHGQSGPIGLELAEWLGGDQMGPAKSRESQRERICRLLRDGWENEYQPQNLRGAFILPIEGRRVVRADEAPLRREFFACVADADRAWLTNPERWRNSYYQTEFPGYPLMAKYIDGIRYIGGEPHGLCWIHEQGDGGAYDPAVTVETLKRVLDKKLGDYSTPERQAHLKAQALTDLYLLVHGGFNAYAYNTPSGPLSLKEIAERGAAFYAAHPKRLIFNRVWFFDSLDSADDINQLLGFPPGYGRVRWLAQLWPDFSVYPMSVAP